MKPKNGWWVINYISISDKVFSGPRQLYVTIGHELIHANDLNPGGCADYLLNFINGTQEEVREQYHAVMEYHAYLWSVPVSQGLGIPAGEERLIGYENKLEYYGLYNLVNEYIGKK